MKDCTTAPKGGLNALVLPNNLIYCWPIGSVMFGRMFMGSSGKILNSRSLKNYKIMTKNPRIGWCPLCRNKAEHSKAIKPRGEKHPLCHKYLILVMSQKI